VIVDDQQFIILPLDGWDEQAQEARLGGRRTCDSDDMYPRQAAEPLVLPETKGGMMIAVFGVGAYQQMLAGRGGAHHCLNPEMRRIVVEEGPRGLVLREVAPQSLADIMYALGYNQPAPARRRAPIAATGRRRSDAARPLAPRATRLPKQPRVPVVWQDG
jgi:arginine decarboxylase